MLLQAAINGARRPSEHPALPVRPHQLAAAAKACAAVGAGAVHFHVRDAEGKESLAAADVSRAVDPVRTACPTIPLGISTGAWIEPDPDRRLGLLRRWTTLPDFASVNFHELGAVEIATELLERGVGVEAGLAGVGAAEELARSGLERRCLRVLLEPPEQDLEAALETVARIEGVLAGSPQGSRAARLLHGTEATAWPLLQEASRRGWDGRMGLEDIRHLPGGDTAGDNEELIRVALTWISD